LLQSTIFRRSQQRKRRVRDPRRVRLPHVHLGLVFPQLSKSHSQLPRCSNINLLTLEPNSDQGRFQLSAPEALPILLSFYHDFPGQHGPVKLHPLFPLRPPPRRQYHPIPGYPHVVTEPLFLRTPRFPASLQQRLVSTHHFPYLSLLRKPGYKMPERNPWVRPHHSRRRGRRRRFVGEECTLRESGDGEELNVPIWLAHAAVQTRVEKPVQPLLGYVPSEENRVGGRYVLGPQREVLVVELDNPYLFF